MDKPLDKFRFLRILGYTGRSLDSEKNHKMDEIEDVIKIFKSRGYEIIGYEIRLGKKIPDILIFKNDKIYAVEYEKEFGFSKLKEIINAYKDMDGIIDGAFILYRNYSAEVEITMQERINSGEIVFPYQPKIEIIWLTML